MPLLSDVFVNIFGLDRIISSKWVIFWIVPLLHLMSDMFERGLILPKKQ